jgi:hypothetical protein
VPRLGIPPNVADDRDAEHRPNMLAQAAVRCSRRSVNTLSKLENGDAGQYEMLGKPAKALAVGVREVSGMREGA